MKEAKPQLGEYYRHLTVPSEEEINKKPPLAANDWQVINCSITELHERLKSLGPGRKQLDVARYEDQVTVVINHLEGVY